MSIVAFCGLKGSGKTTAAHYLCEYFDYNRESFAGPLKEVAMKMFLLTPQQVYEMPYKEEIDPRWGATPRELLQRLGTEVGREFDRDIWVKNLMFRCEGRNAIVIDDCRFPNEADAVKRIGGTVIGIRRPGLKPDNHPSELEMVRNWDRMVDVTIENDKTIEHLHERVWNAIGCPPIPF